LKQNDYDASAKTIIMKKILKYVFIFSLTFGFHLISFSQSPVITKIKKFKPPVVNTFLGIRSNGDTVTIDEASQLIGLTLKIMDVKKNIYKIDSYQFLYEKRGEIQDEETGRKNATYTTVADMFHTTPLPQVWIDNLKGGFQKNEEIYFFDILVKDETNRIFYAPDLKIFIQ
jgi:hypothetical protein